MQGELMLGLPALWMIDMESYLFQTASRNRRGGSMAAQRYESMNPRPVILCADDYGQSGGISAGILALAQEGRLSAVSCLANGPSLAADAPALAVLAPRLDLGLHLCLTEFPPLGPIPGLSPDGRPATLGRVVRLAVAGRLDGAAVLAEFTRQLDRFQALFGRPPDYLDGHQHVHLLPGVRQALFRLLRQRLAGAPVYVRRLGRGPAAPPPAGRELAKVLPVALLGTGFAAALDRMGVPGNDAFRGLHGFDPAEGAAQVAARFRRWFQAPGRRLLVNCHPGLPEPSPSGTAMADAIAATRAAEYAFLSDSGFPALLGERNTRLARFREMG